MSFFLLFFFHIWQFHLTCPYLNNLLICLKASPYKFFYSLLCLTIQSSVETLESQEYGPFMVGGQSYGAYLALMVLVKHPDVCEGGVCISGMYTLFPEYASSWLIKSGCVWMDLTNCELLADRSPVFHLERLTKPVLVIHGARDQYTPISGLYFTLQKAEELGKKELSHVTVYDDEGHGLSKGEHIEETYRRIVLFMDEITK